MRARLVLSLSLLALVSSAFVATAQERPKDTSADASRGTSMPNDCDASARKPHDNGVERNAPSTKPAPCAPADAASSAGTGTKTKPAHDHAKFHKNQ